jgi:hypothetical protein
MQSTTLKSRSGQAPTQWRCVLRIHEAAELLPRMSETELEELGEDIKRHGIHQPIVIFTDQDGIERLLDGISRLDAMERTGLPVVEDGELNPDIPTHNIPGNIDPFAWVLSANVHRRHLTSEQKREVIAKLLKAKPEQSNRTIAKQVKSDHKTVGTVREKLEATGEIPQLQKTTGADGKERRQPEKKEVKTAVAEAMERVSKTPEVEQEKKPIEQPPEDSLATRLDDLLPRLRGENIAANAAAVIDCVLSALRDESVWPPLNAGRKKCLQKVLKQLRGVIELRELAKPTPRRGRPPKGRAS